MAKIPLTSDSYAYEIPAINCLLARNVCTAFTSVYNSCERACRCVSDCPRAGRCVRHAQCVARAPYAYTCRIVHGSRFMPLAAKRAPSRLSAVDRSTRADRTNAHRSIPDLPIYHSTYRERDRRSFTPVDRRHLLDQQQRFPRRLRKLRNSTSRKVS